MNFRYIPLLLTLTLLAPQSVMGQWLTKDIANVIQQGLKHTEIIKLSADVKYLKDVAVETRNEYRDARNRYNRLRSDINRQSYILKSRSRVIDQVTGHLISPVGVNHHMSSEEFAKAYPMHWMPEDRHEHNKVVNQKMMTNTTEVMGTLRIYEQELLKTDTTIAFLAKRLRTAKNSEEIRLFRSALSTVQAQQKTLRDMSKIQITRLSVAREAGRLSHESLNYAEHLALQRQLRRSGYGHVYNRRQNN